MIIRAFGCLPVYVVCVDALITQMIVLVYSGNLVIHSGNSQQIRRSVVDNGRTVLVHNSVTKKDSAEAVATDRYYSKIVM